MLTHVIRCLQGISGDLLSTSKLANQQERVCSASFSLPYSPLALGRVMKNINLNVRPNNFKEYLKKLIFQVVLLDATEVLMSLQNFSATDEPIALR